MKVKVSHRISTVVKNAVELMRMMKYPKLLQSSKGKTFYLLCKYRYAPKILKYCEELFALFFTKLHSNTENVLQFLSKRFALCFVKNLSVKSCNQPNQVLVFIAYI